MSYQLLQLIAQLHSLPLKIIAVFFIVNPSFVGSFIQLSQVNIQLTTTLSLKELAPFDSMVLVIEGYSYMRIRSPPAEGAKSAFWETWLRRRSNTYTHVCMYECM